MAAKHVLQGLQPTRCHLLLVLDVAQHNLSNFDARSFRQAAKQLTAQGVTTDLEIHF